MPGEGAGRLSPSPFEGARPGERGRPGVTAPPSGPREGLSPSPFERGAGRAQEGVRSPAPRPPGEGRPTPRSAFEGAPSQQQQHGRPPARRPGEEPNPPQGGAGQTPPQGHDERIRFGTPAPLGAAEQGQPRGGPSSGFRQQVPPAAGAANADEARARRERIQAAQAQPPPPQQHQPPQQRQQGGAPVAPEHVQGHAQPEGGQRRQPKETPPPGTQ